MVRAVLIATGFHSALQPIIRYHPSPLFRMGDKPIIEHIIEFLVRAGITQCDIVLSHLPEMIEAGLEGGRRWGMRITYHLAKNPARPYGMLALAVRSWQEEYMLLGRGDILPELSPSLLKAQPSMTPTLFYDAVVGAWTGWGLLPSSLAAEWTTQISEEDLLRDVEAKSLHTIHTGVFLSAVDFVALHKSNQKLIAQKQPTFLLPTTAKMVQPGIWISHAAHVHRSAKIVPPVFIGEYTQIAQGAQIGPYTVIENHCFIAQDSVVQNALVCQRSYVGEGLAVDNSVVDRNVLVNLALDTFVIVKDDFILGELKTTSFKKMLVKSTERGVAACLLIGLAPLFLCLLLFYKIARQPVLLLPASHERYTWHTFEWLTFVSKTKATVPVPDQTRCWYALPVLINIFRGEVHFVGVLPRSTQAVESLPADWQNLYLQSKVGWITLADVERENEPHQPNDDDLYAAEAYYTARMSGWYDFTILLRWLKKLI